MILYILVKTYLPSILGSLPFDERISGKKMIDNFDRKAAKIFTLSSDGIG